MLPYKTPLLFLAITIPLAAQSKLEQDYKRLLAEYEEEGGARLYAKQFLKLAESQPEDSIAFDAALWVIKKVRGKKDTDKAIALLAKHHTAHSKIGDACRSIAAARSKAAEPLLWAIQQKHKDTAVKALAAFHLAALLDEEARIIAELKNEPELAARALQYYGKDYGAHLQGLKPALVDKKREKAYETLRTKYGSTKAEDTTMGAIASKALFAIRNLSIGRIAPDIKGTDIDGKPMRLKDYRGKVVLLTFWGHW